MGLTFPSLNTNTPVSKRKSLKTTAVGGHYEDHRSHLDRRRPLLQRCHREPSRLLGLLAVRVFTYPGYCDGSGLPAADVPRSQGRRPNQDGVDLESFDWPQVP